MRNKYMSTNKITEKITLPVAVIIAAIILAVGFYVASTINGPTTEVSMGDTKDDLTFDIDVATLSYQLPSFTKMCLPETTQQCGEAGCNPRKPTVFILYNENNNTLYRCDKKPCDGYEVMRNEGGLFTVLEPVEPRAFSVKLSFDGKYIETVGFGLDTLVSHGTCN